MYSLQLFNSMACKHQIQSSLSPVFCSTTHSSFSPRFSCSKLRPPLQGHLQVLSHIDKPLEPSSSPFSASNTGPEAPLKIGIIGFGNFGQFLAKSFNKKGHHVLATSRSDYSDYCQQHGTKFFRHLNDFCEAQPDIVLVCTSILSTENVVRRIPFHKLKSDTIFADVLPVKQFPKNLFLEILPPGFGILCTHPMFGPDSGNHSWEGLRFVYSKVQIPENTIQDRKCVQFLDIFRNEGCRMVEMSCEEHDRYTAESQFVAHIIGRILSHLELKATPINEEGDDTLLELIENTVCESFDLYYGIFMYNMNVIEQIENLEKAFDKVKEELFERLRDRLGEQIHDEDST